MSLRLDEDGLKVLEEANRVVRNTMLIPYSVEGHEGIFIDADALDRSAYGDTCFDGLRSLRDNALPSEIVDIGEDKVPS